MLTSSEFTPITTFCIVGNPNCGKTTLFNALTGARQEVGNWPGVTVEKKVGIYPHAGRTWQAVDLPGVYALDGGRVSEDERVARDYILSGEAALVVNIVDAANLERNLYLTSQLLEMDVSIVIAVNMMDIARRRGITVNVDRLAQTLGCLAVALVASRKRGLDALKETVRKAAQEHKRPIARPTYGPAIEAVVAALVPKLDETARRHRIESRWLAIRLLEENPQAATLAGPAILEDVAGHKKALAVTTGEEPDILIADGRYGFVGLLVDACVHCDDLVLRTLSDRIDRVVLNRFLGIPIFFAMIYLMFMLTINIGGAFIDFFEQTVGAVLVEGGKVLRAAAVPEVITVIIADGIGGGIQTVATFIPIIGFLYLLLSFLEDSGYMARAAFVMDRGMRTIGLPGKAFVPLIVGFGCNVPAIMATRTLEHRRDRILAMMMAPFMSCGARLPVYALFAAAFFPASGQNIVFALYLIGVAFAIGTGLVLKRTLLQGETAPFVMELPPYHLPTLTTVILRAWHRLKDFVLRAGRMIVPMVVILSILGTVGTSGDFVNRDSDRSVLAKVSQSLMPIFAPMGLTEENWPAAIGLFSGIFAKEAVVGTLSTLYASLAVGEAPTNRTNIKQFALTDKLWAAAATISANLADSLGKLTDPLGLDISFVTDTGQAATALKVERGVFGAMVARFNGTASAFAYLLLVLLYAPCVAALGTISHEVGWRWAVFSAAWGTGIGYVTAVVFYQVMTFGRDPLTAGLWIAAGLTLLCLTLAMMWGLGYGVARGASFCCQGNRLKIGRRGRRAEDSVA